MNKQDLIRAVANKADISQKDTGKVINAMIEVITEQVARGEQVQIIGFGTFEKRTRPARQGRNPRTGEVMEIPEKTAPAFKPGKAFKQFVDLTSTMQQEVKK